MLKKLSNILIKEEKMEDDSGKTLVKWIVGVVVGLLVIVLLLLSFYTVPAGNVGVITRWGAINRVVYPGLGMKIPIAEGLVKMSIRTQKDQVDAAAASKDIQAVTSTIAINYHLDPAYAAQVFQSIGVNYQDIVVSPAILDTWKATTTQFEAPQLLIQREKVREMAQESLANKLLVYHIIVENFNVVNFDFSPEYNASIERKQVASQDVETAKQTQLKVKVDADTTKIKAQVDAETAKIQAQGQADAQKALKDSGALTPEYLKWLALQKWDGILPKVTSGATPFINTSDLVTP